MSETEMLERLAKLDTCSVSDSLDTMSVNGVLLGLAGLSTQRRIVGRAVTVKLVPSDGKKAARHLGTAAVEASGPASVIVVEHNGRTDVAGWGGILSLAAKRRGTAGVIIDGACRDVDEAREMQLPIYARVGVPRTARGRIMEENWNIPVELCGIRIAPGDYLIADGSGVVVIPQDIAAELILRAERIVATEALMAQAVREGEPVSEVMGANYETLLQRTRQ
jgi:4-hydroxy-4-methyl-2-oxoglutarate aldolase